MASPKKKMASGTTIILAPSDFGATAPGFQVAASDGAIPVFSIAFPKLFLCGPNAGLVFQRYMPAHDELQGNHPSYDQPTDLGVDLREIWQWTTTILDRWRQGKAQNAVRKLATDWAKAGVLEWYAALVGRQGIPADLLRGLHRRRRRDLTAARWLTFETASRLAVGLANPAPFENSGVTWQHTYGFPILPGASLKGLARHYLEEEAGGLQPDAPAGRVLELLVAGAAELLAIAHTGRLADNPREAARGCTVSELSSLLFGGSAEAGNEGAVCFHDGWPLEPSGWFEVDVLTSHHLEYYGADGSTSSEASDHDAPNPVHFLVIKPGVAFDFPITLTRLGRARLGRVGDAALTLVGELLIRALEEWGVGGKTGAGYGRMAADGAKAPAAVPAAREA